MKRDKNGIPVPATALPWNRGPVTGIVSGLPQGGTISVTEQAAFHDADDRDYAIHAANCFPQLVKALSKVFDFIEDADAWDKSQVIEMARDAIEAAEKKGGDDAK